MNARYVIATSGKVDLSGIDSATLEKVSASDYFTKEKAQQKKTEEAFFKQGEKPEVRSTSPQMVLGWCANEDILQKKKITSARAADQKAIDQSLLATIKKEHLLASYLATSFSLRTGDKPHEMKW